MDILEFILDSRRREVSVMRDGRSIHASFKLQTVVIVPSLNIQGLNKLTIPSAFPLPLLFAPYTPACQIDMYGLALADIRDSYGAALVGLVLAAMCVFPSLFSPFPAELSTS